MFSIFYSFFNFLLYTEGFPIDDSLHWRKIFDLGNALGY